MFKGAFNLFNKNINTKVFKYIWMFYPPYNIKKYKAWDTSM